MSSGEILTVAAFASLTLIAALVLNRVIAALATAITGVLDLVDGILTLGVALIRFWARVQRVLLRSIVAPVVGPPR